MVCTLRIMETFVLLTCLFLHLCLTPPCDCGSPEHWCTEDHAAEHCSTKAAIALDSCPQMLFQG